MVGWWGEAPLRLGGSTVPEAKARLRRRLRADKLIVMYLDPRSAWLCMLGDHSMVSPAAGLPPATQP